MLFVLSSRSGIFKLFYYIAYEFFRLYFIELLFVISLNKLRRILFCLILISSFCFIGVYADALNKVIIFPNFCLDSQSGTGCFTGNIFI